MDSDYSPDQQVSEVIHGNIETTMQMLEQLPAEIAECSERIVQCLLEDKKILSCGGGAAAAMAHIFTANLLNRFQYERPGLPAINLNADATTLTAIARDNSFQDVFAHQIRSLGQAGDVLLLITDSSSNATLQALQAAHDREMTVIALTSRESEDIAALLSAEDFELRAPSDNRARIAEAHLLTINCLCELVDQHLFGGY